MQIGVVTLFPELFETFARTSFVGRAAEAGKLGLHVEPLRPYGLGKHLSVDDTPYGGGSGMVMRPDCVVNGIEGAERALGLPRMERRILLTPQGEPFRQATARRLSAMGSLLLVCGRYEGFDERIRGFVDEEISLGDFVLTGGEVAAMCVIEAVIRLLPGVLGNETSTSEESFSEALGGRLEYPHYTRPTEFRGLAVPNVLLSGDHGKIAEWRRARSVERTEQRRPDLLADQRPDESRGRAKEGS
jgi:tRNA (guanine37-N1)-methyltransferase